MNEKDDFIGDIIAEVAKKHGIAISRDDPILEIILLNQVLLTRYLEQTLTPTLKAIREERDFAVKAVSEVATEARENFLSEQRALHEGWKTDMQRLIDGQNEALKQVVIQTATALRKSQPAPNYRKHFIALLCLSLFLISAIVLFYGVLR